MFVVISILCLQFLLASSRIIHLRYCQAPNTCTEISFCQQPIFYGIKTAYCGYGVNSLKVCCALTITTTTTTTITSPRVARRNHYLFNHKKFNFLPMDKCGVISSRLRITSGASTSPGEFPWMALIAYRTGNSSSQQEFKCGGTLITERYILTAAHCIDNETILGVRLGEYNIETEIDCESIGINCKPPVQDLLIDKTIIHSFYDPSSFTNDIALIRLATPANYSYENVKPICLPIGDLLETNLEGQELTVAGWGATEQGNRSTILKKVSVPVMANSLCQNLYDTLKPITKKQICAGADHGRDSCAGDSGGPLKRVDLVNNSPRYVQYGIVSFGPSRCGLSKRPGIYTNVQKYVKWILDNLE